MSYCYQNPRGFPPRLVLVKFYINTYTEIDYFSFIHNTFPMSDFETDTDSSSNDSLDSSNESVTDDEVCVPKKEVHPLPEVVGLYQPAGSSKFKWFLYEGIRDNITFTTSSDDVFDTYEEARMDYHRSDSNKKVVPDSWSMRLVVREASFDPTKRFSSFTGLSEVCSSK
jgi:hypothetical protein